MSVKMWAPHGWVRHGTFGGKWHLASCVQTPVCGANTKGEKQVADLPPVPKQSSGASICVTCFRFTVCVDHTPCCCHHKPCSGKRCAEKPKKERA